MACQQFIICSCLVALSFSLNSLDFEGLALCLRKILCWLMYIRLMFFERIFRIQVVFHCYLCSLFFSSWVETSSSYHLSQKYKKDEIPNLNMGVSKFCIGWTINLESFCIISKPQSIQMIQNHGLKLMLIYSILRLSPIFRIYYSKPMIQYFQVFQK